MKAKGEIENESRKVFWDYSSSVPKELEMPQPNSDVTTLLSICVFPSPKCGTAVSSQQQKEFVSIRLDLSGDRHSFKISQITY